MKRKIDNVLANWAAKPERLPLLVLGARQVEKPIPSSNSPGKTTTIILSSTSKLTSTA